jgi:hypothetical protein
MKLNGSALEFFQSLPDDIFMQIALNDRESLERLCVALTLDVQLMNEEAKRLKKKKIQIKN